MISWFTQFLFPDFCVICGENGKLLCKSCKETKLKLYYKFMCHVCGAESGVDGEFVCVNCKDKTSLDGVFVVAHYNNCAKALVEEMKYNFYYAISRDIGDMMKDKLLETNITYDMLVPVPLHKFKYNFRGFNQAELLAKQISINTDDCIIRTKNTKSQVGLNANQRKENLKEVFSLKRTIKYKSVVLVDDVMTTGTTLEECAKVLKQAGVEKVYGLVFARD